MTGYEMVAIVNLLEDCYKKDYAFALYETELEKLLEIKKENHLVIVNPRGKNNRIAGIVKEIMTVKQYGKEVTAQVVAVADMTAYNERTEKENQAKKIAKKKAAIKKELEAEINKLKNVEYYQEMAKKYSDNPRLAELVEELKSLGE